MYTKISAIAALAGTIQASRTGLGHTAPPRATSNKRMADPEFLNYQARYNKQVEDDEEFKDRQSQYHETDDYIRQRNAQADASGKRNALRLKHNELSDRTEEEIEAMMGLRTSRRYDSDWEGLPYTTGGRSVVAATNVDHAASGHMGPVKNQGSCGSCWAFSATSTMEGTIGAKTGVSPPPRISEQQQVDCNRDYKGCDGGSMTGVYRHWKREGAVLEEDYEYSARDRSCKEDRYDRYFEKDVVNTWEKLEQDVDQIKERLLKQPLSIAIHAKGRDFSQYESGVIDGDSCDPDRLNHAVVLVGFTDSADNDNDDDDEDGDDSCDSDSDDDDDDGSRYVVEKWWWSERTPKPKKRRMQDSNGYDRYWKIQNSWGERWGDNGFILFEIQSGKGVCGMYRDVEYVDADDSWYEANMA